MIETISFETYADMFYDCGRFVENENYDNETRVFVVPKDWVVGWLRDRYDNIDDFMNEYTWDETDAMYADACKENVVVSEQIVLRGGDGL